MTKKPYTKGSEDIERVFEVLELRYKEEKKLEWLKERYSRPKAKEEQGDDGRDIEENDGKLDS